MRNGDFALKTLRLVLTTMLTAAVFSPTNSIAAANIIVGNSICTLADAIVAANKDLVTGGCPAGNGEDTLIFAADIELTGELPHIETAIALEGGGHTISGAGRWRIFYVTVEGQLSIKNLTLLNGEAHTEIQPRHLAWPVKIGGAIYNEGRLNISGSFFSGSTAEHGGAIYNYGGSVRVDGSQFNGNSASIRGGAICSDERDKLIVSSSQFTENWAGWGGAIAGSREGTLTVEDSLFRGNVADVHGGAIIGKMMVRDSSFLGNSSHWGGAISTNESTLHRCQFNGNSVTDGGGAISMGHTSTVRVIQSQFTDNSARGSGGAIDCGWDDCALTVSDSQFYKNSAGRGGAIYAETGKVSVASSHFSYNSAEYEGGALRIRDGVAEVSHTYFAGNRPDGCYGC